MSKQRCCECDGATGRCNEDTLRVGDGEPLCEECYPKVRAEALDSLVRELVELVENTRFVPADPRPYPSEPERIDTADGSWPEEWIAKRDALLQKAREVLG